MNSHKLQLIQLKCVVVEGIYVKKNKYFMSDYLFFAILNSLKFLVFHSTHYGFSKWSNKIKEGKSHPKLILIRLLAYQTKEHKTLKTTGNWRICKTHWFKFQRWSCIKYSFEIGIASSLAQIETYLEKVSLKLILASSKKKIEKKSMHLRKILNKRVTGKKQFYCQIAGELQEICVKIAIYQVWLDWRFENINK